MAFKMKRKGFPMKSPMKSSSPFKKTLTCTECEWTDEGIGEPMDTATVTMHYMTEHGSTGPSTGTPGYVSPNQPWGTSWGDPPTTTTSTSVTEGKTKNP